MSKAADRARGTSFKEVYPRVCGGTRHLCELGRVGSFRSIPACAGEPADIGSLHMAHMKSGLSPRVRGNPGVKHCARKIGISGLSPRVRGNPLPCNNSISIRDTCMPRMRIQLYLIRYTPSASTISFGASPSVRIRCSPAADGSRQVMTMAPFRSS